MKSRPTTTFISIRTEGAILPADLLQKIAEGTGLDGLTPRDYHLPEGEKLSEAINRSWLRLLSYWRVFSSHLEKLPPEDQTATSLTRDRWLLPLFSELGYGRLPAQRRAFDLDGEEFPVSHLWASTPIHLIGARLEIDRPARGIPGAARAAPHSMLQDFLNRSPDHLWAFLSNGRRLRVLRDNLSLVRQAYVEFDLAAMMEGELYPDFAILWLLCHQSRLEAARPEECWLEQWSRKAAEEGVRALDQLRSGVEEAIAALGRGFLREKARNAPLLERLRAGSLSQQDYYRQLLRLVYRLVFLFVAEDRDLLFPPDTAPAARKRYAEYFSARRLREIARRVRGSAHPDLWEALKLMMAGFGSDRGLEELGLPALGGFLWSEAACPDLIAAVLPNRDLLSAVRSLSVITVSGRRRVVSYKNLRSEELGSIYEALLELRPVLNPQAASFELEVLAGHERKLTGSYYTPEELVQNLLETALEPVIDDRLKQARAQAVREKSRPDGTPRYPEIAERELLSLKICDPACGSGHFLVAAAHRLARHLARVRSSSAEPPPDIVQRALRDVIGRCVYGVDINPMSVELCKFALWMEALDPGRPLSFLDHHIRCGNSLLGAAPALIAAGLPDEAYAPVEGDDRQACADLKRTNRAQRDAFRHLFVAEDNTIRERMCRAAAALDEMDDSKPETIREKEAAFRNSETGYDYLRARTLADLWCAAFVLPKRSPKIPVAPASAASPAAVAEPVPAPRQLGLFGGVGETPKAKPQRGRSRSLQRPPGEEPIGITTQHLRDLVEGKNLPAGLLEEVRSLARDYSFFHWHLAFPEVFAPRRPAPEIQEEETANRTGGFDCLLGNPPWEHTELKEKEYFASRDPEIAEAKGARRKKLIQKLQVTDRELYREYTREKRRHDCVSHLIRSSGRYPLTAQGRINLYAIFAGLNRSLINSAGSVGCILPSGIATDNNTKDFFADLVISNNLRSLYDFENRQKIFAGIDSRIKFCLLTLARTGQPPDFVFFAQRVADLADQDRHFQVTPEEFALLNPNTLTCPIFRGKKDAELTKHIYRRVPVLIDEKKGEEGNPWKISFKQGLFNMTSDSHLFKTRQELEEVGYQLQGNVFTWPGPTPPPENNKKYLPLYEAKMIHHFDHRWATYEGLETRDLTLEEKQNPRRLALSRYWVADSEVQSALASTAWPHPWLLGWRDITNTTNERTVLFCVMPPNGVGHTIPLNLPDCLPQETVFLLSNLSAFVLDFTARQKVGGTHLTYSYLNQLPVLQPNVCKAAAQWDNQLPDVKTWLLPRVLELTYTACDLEPFAKDCGYTGPPFKWDEERRFQLRCELDAAFFHLYLPSTPEGGWKPARREEAAPYDETDQQLEELKRHFPTPRAAVEYIMDTFPIVKRKDEANHNGTYRTKTQILKIYDQLQSALQTRTPYKSNLTPPPAAPTQT